MKKLLKAAISLAIIATVGVSQIFAESTPNYVIEVKSKKYSKQTTKGLYGLVYTEAYDGYGDANWPLVECYTPFVEANDAFVATDETGASKKFLIRQFGVSMGVVYWINPQQDVIHYWNTFTGEVGTGTPEKGYRGSATPSKHKGLNYVCGDIPGQSGFAYPFSGAQTGIGSVTQDWAGNIVHQWNNVSNAGINTPAQGFAVYKAPAEYGQLIDFEPRLSEMTTQTMPYKRRKIGSDGILVGDDSQANYNDDTSPNPNWTTDLIEWSKNSYYHAYSSAVGGSSKKVVDFMGASGNLFDKSNELVGSDYFYGWWGGQIFLTYNGVTFGNMFADGQYSNWYLNYDLYVNSKPSAVQMTAVTSTIDGVNATRYKPGEYSLKTYPREYMFRECGPVQYFWTLPVSGFYEITTKKGYKWTLDYRYLESSDGSINSTANLPMYQPSHERYGYTMSRGYDAMNVPEVDSIKGQRVLIHNMWLQYCPTDVEYVKNDKTFNMRDGQIQIRSCPYSGGYNATTKKWSGSPTHAYAQVGYGYGYNKQTNNYVNVLNGTTFTNTNTSVNCWSELERVNDNVLALYTNVPGKGFSKYYITAVEQDNPATITGISQKMDGNNNIVNTISWTPQEHDRGTMHRYQIYYRTKKGGAYENAQTIDGATRYPWTLAGVKTVEYKGTYAAGGTFTYDHIAPYGTDANGNYDRQYEYMIMPIYDKSSHYGTETIYPTLITSKAPVCPVEGTLKQVTGKNANGETLYGFSVRLDSKVDINATGANTAAKMVVVPQDDITKAALANNTGVTGSDGVTLTEKNETAATQYTIYNTNDLSVTGYHLIVEGFTVGSGGELPSITWHNIDPEKEYKVKVYVVATSSSYFTPTTELATTLVVPEPKLSLPTADFYKLVGDYGDLTGNEDMPIGSFRRIDPETDKLDETPTNPVTLNNANYYGTNGGALQPLFVTEEVLGKLNASGEYENAGWKVNYNINIYDGNDVEMDIPGDCYDQLATGGWSTVYSNVNNVMCDIVGMNVAYTDAVGEDGRGRKLYDPIPKTYKVEVIVTYKRADDKLEVSRATYSDLLTGATTLPELGVDNGIGSAVTGALYQRDGSHFYYENEHTNGYYPYYYDAAMLFKWEEYTALNRYMGYYGASKMTCYGHYESDDDGNRLGNEWVEYHAGSVLADSYVDGYNSYNAALTNGKIGYDGTNNWSYQAILNSKIPMQIHYVHGGNNTLVNSGVSPASTETAVSDIKFDVTLTAEYPVVVDDPAKFGTILLAEDPATYSISGKSRQMDVMTVPTPLSDMYVTSTTITTGVEGILTEACGGVKLYPNPVGSTLTLEAPMALGEVRILTMNGQLVKVVRNINTGTAKIDVAGLPQGMYIVNTLGVAKIMVKY